MRKRSLSSHEKELWKQVTKDVRRTLPLDLTVSDEEHPQKKIKSPPKQKLDHHTHISALSIVAQKQEKKPSLPQSVFDAGDPKQTRHVRRGRREIDATIDLHGLTQDQAFRTLERFILEAQMRGNKTVLVVTGKGKPGAAEEFYATGTARGILRTRFLQWVEGPFRSSIVRVTQAAPHHGGSGAFYVFIKTRKK